MKTAQRKVAPSEKKSVQAEAGRGAAWQEEPSASLTESPGSPGGHDFGRIDIYPRRGLSEAVVQRAPDPNAAATPAAFYQPLEDELKGIKTTFPLGSGMPGTGQDAARRKAQL